MGANFTPTMRTYKKTGRLHYECQKVLPSVFDDSLSYYECLNKMTDKLNEVIQYVNSARLGTPQITVLADSSSGVGVQEFIDAENCLNIDLEHAII